MAAQGGQRRRTHLNFPGTARAALAFYQGIFGGQVVATTYGELGMPPESPDATNVVFGQLDAENGFRVMAYDIPGRTEEFSGSTHRQHGSRSPTARSSSRCAASRWRRSPPPGRV